MSYSNQQIIQALEKAAGIKNIAKGVKDTGSDLLEVFYRPALGRKQAKAVLKKHPDLEPSVAAGTRSIDDVAKELTNFSRKWTALTGAAGGAGGAAGYGAKKLIDRFKKEK